MPGTRKEIPKEKTYNYYGDDGRKVEIRSLGDHVAFIRALTKDVPRDGGGINGMFA